MIKFEDPLSKESEIEVGDVAGAMYTLKITNDNYFAVNYMRRNVEKEYSRNAAEVFEMERDLVEPYLLTDTSATYTYRLTVIPKPLPEVVPKKVREAVEWLDEQLSINKQRLDAELAEETEPLNESRRKLEKKVRTWFKSEVERSADWLGGSHSCTLSGCTLSFNGGNVSFSYKEMSYE